MPIDSVAAALVSSIIESIVEAAGAPRVPAQPRSFVEAPGLPRTIPGEAKLGEMQPPQMGAAIIDGQPLRLTPGAQIRTAQNAFVLPSMVAHPTMVRYTVDFTGAVNRIWILSPDEVARLPN